MSAHHGWQLGATVQSTCTRCKALGHDDTPHVVLEVHGEGVFGVRCSSCGHGHRDKLIGPQPGPQTDFMLSSAYIVLYGGARGGGKSFALEMIALLYCHIPGWTGLIIRHELGDITKAGGLWDKAKRCFAGTGAVFVQSPNHHVTWPSGAKLDFGYLKDQNIDSYQGQEYTYIGVDEATHFTMDELMVLVLCNRSTCGAPCFIRWTCNPDPDHPLREFVEPWILPDGTADQSKSGAIRFFAMLDGRRVWGDTRQEVAEASGRPDDEIYEFSYVPALVEHNQILLDADPHYVGKLAMLGPVIERQHRYGDWNAKPVLRGLLKDLLTRVVDKPLATIVARARFYDMAHTEPHPGTPDPDYTAGARMELDTAGNIYLAGLVVCRKEGPGVLELMLGTAALDGPMVAQGFWVDPSAGKSWAGVVEEKLRRAPRGGPVTSYPCGNRLNQKIDHANPVAEHLRQGKLFILAGPWLEVVYAEAGGQSRTMLDLIRGHVGSFPSEKAGDKDDIVDAMSGAFRLVGEARVVVGSPRETAAAAQQIARERLRGGQRSDYGGRR